MTNIVVTNIPEMQTGVVIRDLVGGWKLCFTPDNLTTHPNEKIGVNVIGNVFAGKYSDKLETRLMDQTIYFPKERLEWVANEDYLPLKMLIAAIARPDKTDDLSIYLSDNSDDAEYFLLNAIIPGVCSCGNNVKALEAYQEILKYFTHHPIGLVQKKSVYDDGYKLAMAYQIDVVGDLIEHGSSIGGSYLTTRGCLLALAIELFFEE